MNYTIKFVEPECEVVTESDLVRKVEMAYRVCYKSEGLVSETSKALVQRLTSSRIPARHTSPLEHAWIKVTTPREYAVAFRWLMRGNEFITVETANTFVGNFRAFHDFLIRHTVLRDDVWISDNVIVRELGNQLHAMYPEVFPSIYTVSGEVPSTQWKIEEYDSYHTFRIVTTRDILQELARHRSMSFSVESTRYCNYGNKGYTFVIPRPYEWTNQIDWSDTDKLFSPTIKHLTTSTDKKAPNSMELIDEELPMLDTFLANCVLTSARYDNAIKNHVSPQEARMLLPGALKTELFMTGTNEQWQHFLMLRNTTHAHPMIQYLAKTIATIVNN